MNNKVVFGIIGLLVIVGIGYSIFLIQPHTLTGSVIDPPQPAPDFQLQSSQGGTFDLEAQKGKVMLVFFGYTYCPDVCPTTLYEFKQIEQRLGDQAANVEFVFITVDPQRDTQDQLKRYLAGFSNAFYGLTADEESLIPVWKDYGVFREIQDSSSASGYLVNHSSRTYLIDQNGYLRSTYLFDSPINDYVADLKFLLKN